MNIDEMLKTQEAKKEYRELVLKYHSDRNPEDDEIIRKINNAKDDGDEALHKIYKELTQRIKNGPIVKEGTDIKTINKWTDEIQNVFPMIFFNARYDAKGAIYLELKFYKGKEIETYFVMNVQQIKSKEELIQKIRSKVR